MVRALLRSIPDSFVRAIAAIRPEPPIDPVLARVQHAAYRAALEACGAGIEIIAADEDCPDCCFVEDTAVVAGGAALIARSGAPSRRAEAPAVAKALQRLGLRLVQMTAPGTLDGGDCMQVGGTIYVGRSARTNAEGIAQLARALPQLRLVPVELPAGVLHLKCVCSPLGSDRIALAEDSIPAATFDAGIVWIPAAERYASNVVAVGAHAVVAEGHPRTQAALARAGFTVHPVPVSEVRKADGSLTCQSILV
ncbi:MAG TPA: arginine deiminase family protein [Myxococcales bacterium]|nr:arginine deiminase family protein [Myxococcales bacterium]